MSKPRILIIENSIGVTGALKSITRTAYDLKYAFDFEFVIPRHSQGRFWIEAKGFSVIHELPMKEISRRVSSLVLYLPYLIINSLRLKKIIKQNGVDVLHVNDFYNLVPVAIRLLGCTTPYICHIRFLPNRFPKRLMNFWLWLHLKYGERVITVSQSVMKMLPPHEKLLVIPNELPVEERYPESLHATDGNSGKIFLYLSNFMEGKGQRFALEAFSEIHIQLPDWRMKFVGSTMGLRKNELYLDGLKVKANKLGIGGKVAWNGFTEEVEREYKEADIVLNFSESESFSITCLESLFFGRPLIATDCGGPAEIIDHEETGILVPNRSVEAMAAAMKRMALDEKLRSEMGVRARNTVKFKFSVEKTSMRLKFEYDVILKSLR